MKRRRYGRIAQGTLAIVGVVMFAMLARRVDFAALDSSADSFPLLLITIAALAALNYLVETIGWWLISDRHHASFRALISIRLRGESITNLLPGGALIGEPMKIAMLMQATGMSRAEAATSFLLSKLITIVGHALYVVTGVTLSYAVINGASTRVFGTAHFATLALGTALTIFLLLVSLFGAMVWFRPMARWLSPSSRDGRWTSRWNVAVTELHRIEELIIAAARSQGPWLLLGLLCCFVAWSLNGVESFVILRWLKLDVTLTQSYAIDSVSSVVRMILFVLPIGIGGQDWTITGLMMIYGFTNPVPTAAGLVILKRTREFFMIGIGLALLAVTARRKVEIEKFSNDAQVSEERSTS